MKDSPTIFFIVGGLDTGGGERHLTWLLPGLIREGFRPVVCTLTNKGTQGPLLEAAGVCVKAPPFAEILRPFRSAIPRCVRVITLLPITLIWLSWQLVVHRPRIVHSFLTMGIWVGGLLSVIWRIPLRIASRRSLNQYLRESRLARSYECRLLRYMTVVLANSYAVMRQLRDEENVPIDKLGLIFNGIPLPAPVSQKGKTQARELLGLLDDAVVLSIVANLSPHKGHRDLISAMADIHPQLPAGWQLLIVGRDDGERESLICQIKKAGITKNVRFLGECDKVPMILSAADVGLLCSHREAFSNAILEGMAAGLPMIVTDVGGNPEAVIHEETGLVVPSRSPAKLGEAILRLIRDATLRARMGQAGRERVEENFSIERCLENYTCLYNNLLNGQPISKVSGLRPDKS